MQSCTQMMLSTVPQDIKCSAPQWRKIRDKRMYYLHVAAQMKSAEACKAAGRARGNVLPPNPPNLSNPLKLPKSSILVSLQNPVVWGAKTGFCKIWPKTGFSDSDKNGLETLPDGTCNRYFCGLVHRNEGN